MADGAVQIIYKTPDGVLKDRLTKSWGRVLYCHSHCQAAMVFFIVIVIPGSLVEQWRDEMFEKFGLEFRIFSKELELATPSGNSFEDLDYLIVRLDQMARNRNRTVVR